jgi:hypothetical protein
MAGITHVLTSTKKNDSGFTIFSDSYSVTATAEVNFKEVVPAGSFIEIDVDIDVSQIVSFGIEGTAALQMETNARGTGHTQTYALAAKKGLGWDNTDQVNANPLLSVDITKIFFTNAGLADATVVGGFLLDI